MGYEWDIPIKGGWVTCPLGSCEKKTCWLNTQKNYFRGTSPCLSLKSPLYHLISRPYLNIPSIFHHVISNHPNKSLYNHCYNVGPPRYKLVFKPQ